MRIKADPPTDPSDYSFVHDVRVRFAETDAMGIVHHASYLPYLEEARVAYLRSIDHDYVSVRESGVNLAVIADVTHVNWIPQHVEHSSLAYGPTGNQVTTF